MFGFLKSKSPIRTTPSTRSFLRLEELDVRATPSDLGDLPPSNPPAQAAPPAPQPAPNIDTFAAVEVAHGWYTISGHVASANPNGLVVTFAGVPSLAGQTAVVDANGNFSITIQVATDGSDIGTISAQTIQGGTLSNTALTYMSPTP